MQQLGPPPSLSLSPPLFEQRHELATAMEKMESYQFFVCKTENQESD